MSAFDEEFNSFWSSRSCCWSFWLVVSNFLFSSMSLVDGAGVVVGVVGVVVLVVVVGVVVLARTVLVVLSLGGCEGVTVPLC